MYQRSGTMVPKDLYKEQYSPEFAGRWDELINWQRRAETENNFFQEILREHGSRESIGHCLRHRVPHGYPER